MKKITPIAMRCNKEQFEAINPKLKGIEIGCVSNFNEWNYLVNNADGDPFVVCNTGKSGSTRYNRKTYETWNERIFLEACGIKVMKPTLEEVKEYFKDAEFVETISFKEKRKIDLGSIATYEDGDFLCVEKESGYIFYIASLKLGFAKILTTKEKAFSITAEQLMQLENGFTLPKLKQWFPETFKVKLEVGKWYKSIGLKSGCLGFKGIGMFTDEEIESGFGLDDDLGTISLKSVNGRVWGVLADKFEEATEQEVFEALKNEAIKRGFVEGARITPMFPNGNDYFSGINTIDKPLSFIFEDNILKVRGGLDCYRIFVNGKWATIIPTKTKEEAEKLLNCKIID